MKAKITPDAVRELRRAAGLSSAQAARIVGLANYQAWQRHENDGPNQRAISEGSLRLFLWQTKHLPALLRLIGQAAGKGPLRRALERVRGKVLEPDGPRGAEVAEALRGELGAGRRNVDQVR